MTKDEAIKKEVAKLSKIFKDIPKDKQKLVEHLIQNAAFMAITLLELQDDINENGPVVTVMGGNGYEMVKDNPSQKAYTTMIAKYSAIINQLTALLPDTRNETVAKAGESLAAFVAKGKAIEHR